MIRGWADVRAAIIGACVGVLAFFVMVVVFATPNTEPPADPSTTIVELLPPSTNAPLCERWAC